MGEYEEPPDMPGFDEIQSELLAESEMLKTRYAAEFVTIFVGGKDPTTGEDYLAVESVGSDSASMKAILDTVMENGYHLSINRAEIVLLDDEEEDSDDE